MQLKIDPEFRDKIPPLTHAEFKQLEDNIVKDRKVRDPIVVWGETIIDGHNRWSIIQKHPEIPYTTTSMDFPDKWAAIVWMCQNQLGRRSITAEQRAVLIAQEYDAQKKTVGAPAGNDNAKKQSGETNHLVSEPKPKTRAIVARTHGITENAVKSAVEFSHGLDAADEVAPGFKSSVMSGTIKAPKSVIASLPKLEEPERKKAVQAIQNGERVQPIKPQEPEIVESTCAEYNSDDLKMELDACTDTFFRNFKDTLVFHSTMIQDTECKKKIEAALSEAETAIKKLRGYVS
ncbi:MAG: hypothetical protein AAGU27_24835 [Dehalobacterium sp.]